LALENLESDNIVVRTIADVAIRCTQRVQPGRIEELLPSANVSYAVKHAYFKNYYY